MEEFANSGIRMADRLGNTHLFRFAKKGSEGMIKHTSSGSNIGIEHYLNSKNAQDLIKALETILD